MIANGSAGRKRASRRARPVASPTVTIALIVALPRKANRCHCPPARIFGVPFAGGLIFVCSICAVDRSVSLHVLRHLAQLEFLHLAGGGLRQLREHDVARALVAREVLAAPRDEIVFR